MSEYGLAIEQSKLLARISELEGIARELAEALEHCYGKDHDAIDKKRAALYKARAAGILNALDACRCGHSKEQHDGHTFQPGSTPPNHCSACRCAAYLPPAKSGGADAVLSSGGRD